MSLSSSFADLSSNSSFNPFVKCFTTRTSIHIFSAFSITNLLLLPVFTFVLYLGFQRWRKQRSTATSHSDIFTYHCVAMQLNELFGFILYFTGSNMDLLNLALVGFCVGSVTVLGKALLHILTCVERYLAIVHPVTYLRLKQAGGVKIRNISLGCVWLITFGCLPAAILCPPQVISGLNICTLTFALIETFFCSVSVLRALRRPGPGDKGATGERVDQSKQRAFYTIMGIMGVLSLSFGANAVATVMYGSVGYDEMCLVMMATYWFDMPSSLVLPLLFLHRAGKLQCCKPNAES
ncbi:hypothetical protein GBF38_004935 [Nibea albiflora]|uniref:Uncharacterized protein n=1 Tax=Nibea albiflora TaxID=240163 RepID=A0ACB7EUJ1_NIBAL|nr:hypothetical protein GBF38_004935 [Nibea albiflora]